MYQASELIRRLRQRMDWELRKVRTLSEAAVGTRWYDLVTARSIELTPGSLPPSSRIAIYVMFPVEGVLESHLLSLRYLSSRGYAPLVISNVRLGHSERARVATHAWTLMERPNFGYDFGAYRDGLLYLEDQLSRADVVALFNDSVWFPLPGGRDWLADLEVLDADMVGAVPNYCARMPSLEAYASAEWVYDPSLSGYHYCSFALAFRQRILRDARFSAFWRGFRLTDDKKLTVQRGEVGLSNWVLSRGYDHAPTLDISGLGEAIDGMGERALIDFVKDLIIPEELELRQLRSKVLTRAGREGWLDEARGLAKTVVARTGAAYVMPRWAHENQGHPFLKKSPLRLDAEGAKATLRFLGSLEGSDAEVIRAEATRLASRWKIGPRDL
jgi:hypothetical protein